MVKYELWGNTVDIEVPKDVFPSEERQKELDETLNNPTHGYFEGTHEGKKIYYRKYLPEGTPKGIIVWQHGIHGQSGFGLKLKDGRYIDCAIRYRLFTKEGFAVYASDQLGHGYSEGARFLIPKGMWQINRDDLVKFAKLAASEHDENIPLFLSGDSYGGCLAVHAARVFQDKPEDAPKGFTGILLNSPAIIGDLPPKPVVAFLRRLAKLTPAWRPFFMPHPVSSDRIWKDKEPRDYYDGGNDGLSLGGAKFSLGTALGLLEALESVREEVIPGFKVPFSINHGTADESVLIEGSIFMMENSATPDEDKILNKIEGGYHDLYSEVDAEKTMMLELNWIKEQIAKKQKS